MSYTISGSVGSISHSIYFPWLPIHSKAKFSPVIPKVYPRSRRWARLRVPVSAAHTPTQRGREPQLLLCASVHGAGDPAHSPWWELCQDPGDFLEVAAELLGGERLTEEEGLRLGGRRAWVQILPPTLTRHAAWEGPCPLCTFVFSFVKGGRSGRCGDRRRGDGAWPGA